MSAVLVIGATGVLAPLAAGLRSRGDRVIAVSRRGGDDSIAVDATDTAALAAALGHETWSHAVVYEPAVSEESLAFVQGTTPGRCVRVRTSARADPDLGPLVVAADTLQLGWHKGTTSSRWHTPREISEAAMRVLADGEPVTLGTVRPWSDRP
jgi:hypothetical protein